MEFNADFCFLQLNSTNLEVRYRNNLGNNFDMVYSGLALNTWNHFLATYNGSMVKLYHNGVAVDSVSANGVITNTTTPFHIGTVPFQSTDFDLDGRLDDVCLWNRALTASEANAWYNACTPDLNDQGLQLCYLFNQGIGGGNNTGITSAIDAQGNINAALSGLTLTGNTSNFITHGNPNRTVLVDSASCTYTYTSPSGTFV